MKKKFLYVLAFSIMSFCALPANADLHMYCKINGVKYELGDVIKRFGNSSKAVIGCCDLTKVCGPNYISNVEGSEYLHSLSLIAAKYNHVGSLKYLIDVKGVGYESWPMKKGSDGYYRDYKDYTQLMYAVRNGNAEMVEYLETGADNVLCLQPFACLPNHITGKGVMRVLRKIYPKANLCAIDFEAGTSRANFTNRLKLFMAQARANAADQLSKGDEQ